MSARKCPVAALITEPVLQNIGLSNQGRVSEGLRAGGPIGFLLIFDEVRLAFATASPICGNCRGKPDLAVTEKRCQGYPIAVLAERKEWMDWVVHPERESAC